ncbi:MAG: type II secretion system F family protein [Candidatus Pacebacteria bacterium]|nr:type II secretion system F family protein [Candidatus Paceibacterota bacterium]
MKFYYQARTKKGKIQSGSVEASSKEAAIELLKFRNLVVTSLEEIMVPIYAKKLVVFELIRKKEVVIFSRQLAIMLKSKIPLIETFQTLAKQTKNSSFREKIIRINEEIEGGTSLSAALSLYPKLFSPFYINMVKSGEASGKLTDVFIYLADYLEKENRFREKIIGALSYPAFILIVFFSVIAIIVSYVIPQLAEFLKETGQDLPMMTKIVIGAADFLKTSGWMLIFGTVILLVSLFALVKKNKKAKEIFDNLIIRIPLLGSFFKKFFLSRFALNLSTLISGGLPIAQALGITSEVVGNSVYRKIIIETRDGVKKGERISFVLEKYPEEVYPLFYQMVVVGEKTGTMDSTLKNVVEFYQDEIDRTSDNIIKLLEPLLIVFIGVLVGGIALAVLIPIYSFGGAI